MEDFSTFLRKNGLWLLLGVMLVLGVVSEGPERAIYLLATVLVGLKIFHEKKLLVELERIQEDLSDKVQGVKTDLESTRGELESNREASERGLADVRSELARKILVIEERIKEIEAIPRSAQQKPPIAKDEAQSNVPPVAAVALGLMLVLAIGYPFIVLPQYQSEVSSLRQRLADTLVTSSQADSAMRQRLAAITDELASVRGETQNHYDDVNESIQFLENCSAQQGCYQGQKISAQGSTITYSSKGSLRQASDKTRSRGNYSRVKRTEVPSSSELITITPENDEFEPIQEPRQ